LERVEKIEGMEDETQTLNHLSPRGLVGLDRNSHCLTKDVAAELMRVAASASVNLDIKWKVRKAATKKDCTTFAMWRGGVRAVIIDGTAEKKLALQPKGGFAPSKGGFAPSKGGFAPPKGGLAPPAADKKLALQPKKGGVGGFDPSKRGVVPPAAEKKLALQPHGCAAPSKGGLAPSNGGVSHSAAGAEKKISVGQRARRWDASDLWLDLGQSYRL
jgi:hypothetical protein